ncbi:MAG: hypothetical protein HQL55_18900 [Magnetococcales bacterium]|nr:hypothetical protein [Magnetococcales bacterium]
MADTGDNISTVASAVEEMTANLAGVRSRCQEANSEALQAQKDARATAEVMERLRRTTREIGKVVEVIKSIAEQTNLLALNASIEAAGAGALGRGFAVVASEVKELASQTRKATDTIRKQVEGIQVNTSEASKATDRVFQTIGNLAQSNEEILNAVSDQTQALNEITQSVAMVSQQTGEVVELVNRTTLELTEVDQQIQEISTAVTEVGRNVQDGVNTSRNVAQQALDSRERALRMLQQAQVMVDAALAVKERALEAKDRMGYLQGTTRQIGQLVEVVSVVSRELGTAQQQFRVGSSRIDIQSLKAAHLAWMMELNQLFSGRLQVMVSMQEDSCDICRFLAGVMEETGEEGMVVIQQGHQKLHTLLREIITLKEQGSDSSQVLDEFNKERIALFDAMDHLYLG